MSTSDISWIKQNPYFAYTYAYPHKSAYRNFETPKPLSELWSKEKKTSLFLYIHIPFCEMRCGFCNLLTTANPSEDLTTCFLQTLKTEMEIVNGEIDPINFGRLAVGGGTPTFLKPSELGQLFADLDRIFGVRPQTVPSSVETSPQTATADRLSILADAGIERISIGIQSFDDNEARAMGRPQKRAQLEQALDNIRGFSFPRLNLDLIYGAANQTTQSFCHSLHRAMTWSPEEIYLYPLYVRPLTGLDGRAENWDDHRLELYKAGRDFLLERGYSQISMRMFAMEEDSASVEYCCQEDGMIGLGAGARTYTTNVHYSSEYAVDRMGVLSILHRYCNEPALSFQVAKHGFELDDEEIVRRDVIKSILRHDGLDVARFERRFGNLPERLLPQLGALYEAGYIKRKKDKLIPTTLGLTYADAIGPWLFSERMKEVLYRNEATAA